MIAHSALFASNFLSGAGLNRGYSEELADRLEARGWQITRTSAKRARTARLIDMVYTTVAQRRAYELAHIDVFSGPSFVWAEAVCSTLRTLRKPYVLTLRGGNLPVFAQRWPRRTRRLFNAARRVTVPSRYLGETMSHYRSDLAVIPNAIDVGAHAFSLRASASPRLIWVRALHAVYNPLLAVEVLARLAPRGATLAMLGPDKDGSRELVAKRAAELGVSDRLELVGRVNKADIPRYLASADIFLNTTNIDNTPISVLEAMASGLCVVSTSVGGIPFLLTHERDALLVPRDDVAAMVVQVERVLDEPALSRALSAAARSFAEQFDWTRVLHTWELLFDEVRRG